MSKEFKIGDRVIFDNFGKDKKGVIQRINLDDIERIEMQVKRFTDRDFFRVLFDDGESGESDLCHRTFLRLDVQYYRELRLNKLLDKT